MEAQRTSIGFEHNFDADWQVEDELSRPFTLALLAALQCAVEALEDQASDFCIPIEWINPKMRKELIKWLGAFYGRELANLGPRTQFPVVMMLDACLKHVKHIRLKQIAMGE